MGYKPEQRIRIYKKMEMTTDRRLVEGKGERRRESEHWEGLVPNGLERLLDRVRLVNLRTEIRLDFAERIALAYRYQNQEGERRRATIAHGGKTLSGI